MTRVNSYGEVILNTGKIIHSVGGTIGIRKVGEISFEITYGYDGGVDKEDDELTLEERRELADYCINMWNKWAISKPGSR